MIFVKKFEYYDEFNFTSFTGVNHLKSFFYSESGTNMYNNVKLWYCETDWGALKLPKEVRFLAQERY